MTTYYYNHARKLRSPEPVPEIRLTNAPPPADAELNQDILGLLRRRFGQLGNG